MLTKRGISEHRCACATHQHFTQLHISKRRCDKSSILAGVQSLPSRRTMMSVTLQCGFLLVRHFIFQPSRGTGHTTTMTVSIDGVIVGTSLNNNCPADFMMIGSFVGAGCRSDSFQLRSLFHSAQDPGRTLLGRSHKLRCLVL